MCVCYLFLLQKQKEMPTTLKDVTGIVLPGQSLAIMGSSGTTNTPSIAPDICVLFVSHNTGLYFVCVNYH